MSVCPGCEGDGSVLAVLCTQGCGMYETSLCCPVCRGEGEVGAEKLQQLEEGRRLRQDRLRRRLSQRQEAARLGVPVEELSKREAGLLV